MNLFKILKGDSSRISTIITPFHDGYVYFTPDNGKLYIDSIVNGNNQRICINPDRALTAEDIGALPISGGTLTGDLIGTRLQMTQIPDLTTTPSHISVLGNDGLFYKRTPEELLKDISGQEKIVCESLIIPTSGWSSDSVERFQYFCDVTAQVTAKDKVEVIIETASLYTAANCGLCSTVETMAGKIRIRAQKVPTQAINTRCCITKGVM